MREPKGDRQANASGASYNVVTREGMTGLRGQKQQDHFKERKNQQRTVPSEANRAKGNGTTDVQA